MRPIGLVVDTEPRDQDVPKLPNMFQAIILLASAVLCLADLPVPPPVRCGETPSNIYKCLGNPTVVPNNVVRQCVNTAPTECRRYNCIFDKAGWLSGGQPNKAKIQAHFENYAREHPAWAPAVQRVKTDCLTGTLQPQGWELNCPAYDIMHCALTTFFKNASPSQWSSSSECAATRVIAEACPNCPDSCFAPAIPVGSCNACRQLPRSP